MPRALSLGQDVPVPDTPEQAKAREDAERMRQGRALYPEQSFLSPARAKFGRIGIDEWRLLDNRGVHLHVYINGQNVTKRTQWADDLSGEVSVLKVNEEGDHYRDPKTQDVAREVLFGDVAFEVIHKSPSVRCDAC